jgi:peptidyl-prolyl cis-trans isomerase SurA
MPFTPSFRFRSLAAATLALAAACAALAAAAAPSAGAEPVQRIAAVVNDSIISLRDVEARLDFVIVTSNVPNTPQARRQFLPRVLHGLIDDELKLQEAKRLGITVSDSEIEDAKRRIESGNGMPPGLLDRMLRQKNVPVSTFEHQLRAGVAWIKAMRGQFRRDLFVQPEEIDAVLESKRRNLGKPERLLSEIVLTTDPTSDNEDQVRKAAERLVSEIRNGADFALIARQFSNTATAGNGGALGWVPEGALNPDLEAALRETAVGAVTDPVRTTTGYTLLYLQDRRNRSATPAEDLRLQLSQLYMPTSGSAAVPPETRRTVAETLRDAKNCSEIDSIADEMRLPSSGSIGELTAKDLPPPLRAAVVDLPENTLSPLVPIQGAEVLIMVCAREDPNGLPSREEIEQEILQTKMERAGEQTLRSLRTSALIDIRL